jgi:hypothetical protein
VQAILQDMYSSIPHEYDQNIKLKISLQQFCTVKTKHKTQDMYSSIPEGTKRNMKQKISIHQFLKGKNIIHQALTVTKPNTDD